MWSERTIGLLDELLRKIEENGLYKDKSIIHFLFFCNYFIHILQIYLINFNKNSKRHIFFLFCINQTLIGFINLNRIWMKQNNIEWLYVFKCVPLFVQTTLETEAKINVLSSANSRSMFSENGVSTLIIIILISKQYIYKWKITNYKKNYIYALLFKVVRVNLYEKIEYIDWMPYFKWLTFEWF